MQEGDLFEPRPVLPEIERQLRALARDGSRALHEGPVAADLVRFAQAIRRLDVPGIREVSSTRVLIAAARLTEAGLPLPEAAQAAIVAPLTDDRAVGARLAELLALYLPD